MFCFGPGGIHCVTLTFAKIFINFGFELGFKLSLKLGFTPKSEMALMRFV